MFDAGAPTRPSSSWEQALLHHETLAHPGPILRRECLIRESGSASNHDQFFNEIGPQADMPFSRCASCGASMGVGLSAYCRFMQGHDDEYPRARPEAAGDPSG